MSTKISDVINFNKPYIIVDFEANGDLHNPFLLQVGAIRIVNGKIVDSFNKWCYYDGEISKFISFLLNKDANFYLSQEPESKVWTDFLDFCNDVDQIFNFGKYYDELIIEKVHERTGLPKINLIDIQDKYFNKMCGITKQGQAVVSLDIVNKIFYNNDDFDHIEHDAYEDCILLFNTIKNCQIEEQKNYDALVKKFYDAYLIPRPKNFRGISKKTKTLDFIRLKNNAPIVFIYHWVEKINDIDVVYNNQLFLIDNDIKTLKKFCLQSWIDNNHDFYSNFKETEEYIYEHLGLNNYIFVSNVDFLIKKIQTSYASKTKIYPLIYWIPFEWIKIRLNFENNTLNENQFLELFDLFKKIYVNYWNKKTNC